MRKLSKFNDSLAEKITSLVGTMWTAYAFAILGCIAMYGAFTSNITLTLISGSISGYFLQLVLLPIIIVGQNLQAAKHDSHTDKLEEIHQHLKDNLSTSKGE